MEFILFSVLCSVAVSVVLKLTPKTQWDTRQLIGGGYLVAATLCWFWLQPNPQALFTQASASAWAIFLVLGVLLPSLFFAIAKSVEHAGIVLTDVAQRLALILPLLAAFLWFGETFTKLKGVGLTLGVLAILCILWRPNKPSHAHWRWPLLVFVGMGFVDILFKQMSLLSQMAFADILFATFVLAFILCAGYLAWLFFQRKTQWHWHNVLGALALGTFNFGNIIFYIKAHQSLAEQPSTVFASMNIGVIVLGSLVGLGVFKERLNRLNLMGVGMAVTAVWLITG